MSSTMVSDNPSSGKRKPNGIISEQQARAITGGRAPLVPIEYEEAVKSLVACQHIDEAKYWDNRADAQAAWAKIVKSESLMREARALKLHAFRRLSQLTREIYPAAQSKGGRIGQTPGPFTQLQRLHGFSDSEAKVVQSIGRLSEQQFQMEVDRPRPLSPTTISGRMRTGGSETWKTMSGTANSPLAFSSYCRCHDARKLVADLTLDEIEKIRPKIIEMIEWLDAFEQALPK